MSGIPDWLESFTITVRLENQEQLFDSRNDNIENLKFSYPDNPKISIVGTKLYIEDILYEIKDFQIYHEGMFKKTSVESRKLIELIIIVNKKSN